MSTAAEAMPSRTEGRCRQSAARCWSACTTSCPCYPPTRHRTSRWSRSRPPSPTRDWSATVVGADPWAGVVVPAFDADEPHAASTTAANVTATIGPFGFRDHRTRTLSCCACMPYHHSDVPAFVGVHCPELRDRGGSSSSERWTSVETRGSVSQRAGSGRPVRMVTARRQPLG